jgi:hypothetical protein
MLQEPLARCAGTIGTVRQMITWHSTASDHAALNELLKSWKVDEIACDGFFNSFTMKELTDSFQM